MDSRIDNMVANPRSFFRGPLEVLDHDELDTSEKLRILESWKFDAQQLADGTAENMGGGEETDLRDVSKALVQLKTLTETPTVVKPQRRRRRAGVGVGALFGAIVGAAAGLLLLTVTNFAPLATVMQATVIGTLIGGLAALFRDAVQP